MYYIITALISFIAGAVCMYLWMKRWKAKALNLMQEQTGKIDEVLRKAGG
jgi:hypothetical protein